MRSQQSRIELLVTGPAKKQSTMQVTSSPPPVIRPGTYKKSEEKENIAAASADPPTREDIIARIEKDIAFIVIIIYECKIFDWQNAALCQNHKFSDLRLYVLTQLKISNEIGHRMNQ